MGRLVARASDRMVARLVPATTAAASDCQVEYWCDRDAQGSALMRRTCCLQANGHVSCGTWTGVCDNCC